RGRVYGQKTPTLTPDVREHFTASQEEEIFDAARGCRRAWSRGPGRCCAPVGRKGSVMRKFIEMLKDESGMETVEWAILAAVIVAGLVAVITTLGSNIVTKFTNLRNATT